MVKYRKSRDVTVILGDSIIKEVKGWELTDDSNKVVVKSFRGATTSQMKWHVKPTTEQNLKNIILHCGTYDINDDSDPENIAEEIVELAKSISKDCSSNVTVSGIVPRYGKLNEKVRSVNRLLRIYCRNKNMRYVGHDNINPTKHLSRSGLHLNHLGTPILSVNFLNVLNSLDSEQLLKSKGSKNSDKNSGKSENLNEVTFLHQKFTKNLFFGHLDVHSVRNKCKALEFLIKDKFDVFLVSESKLIQVSLKLNSKSQVIGFFDKIEVNTEVV